MTHPPNQPLQEERSVALRTARCHCKPSKGRTYLSLLAFLLLLLSACEFDKFTEVPNCIPEVTFYSSEAVPMYLVPPDTERMWDHQELAPDEYYVCAGVNCRGSSDRYNMNALPAGQALELDGFGVEQDLLLADPSLNLRGKINDFTVWIDEFSVTQFDDPPNLESLKETGLVDDSNELVQLGSCPNL